MNLLFIGDVFGRPGRGALKRHLRRLIDERGVDFTIANAENSAGGAGATEESCQEMFKAGVDCLTSGNHVWDKREVLPYLEREPRLIRPANYPEPCAGSGLYLGTARSGERIAVLNLIGRTYLVPLDCPFRTADQLLEELRGRADCIVVDMHAEATSEKVAMGWYLDGRVAAVLGTHTHVQTADEKILPRGSAYITDVGMTGAHDSVIGVEKEQILERFLTQRPVRFRAAEGDVRLHGVLVETDPASGLALRIERIALSD